MKIHQIQHIHRIMAVAILICGCLVAGQAATAAESPWCASGKTVKFAGLNWESGSVLTEVMRTVMEKGYGCKTDSIPGNTVTMEVALSKNDIQVLAEEWVGRSDAWN